MDDGQDGLGARLVREAIAALDAGAGEISLRGLAKAAGVSAMAPYRHFPDKTALLRAVSDRGFAMLAEALATADRAPDEREALTAQGLAYLAFAQAHPALFRLMFSGGGDGGPPGAAKMAAYGVLAGRVARLTPNPAAVTACWALVHGLAILTLDGQSPPDGADSRAVLALLAEGVLQGGA
ncbi:TetR/AcrR family transcriptional regulator [Methylopila musalis]|uniref:TetR/AcrR family transcriptional regulator n=2 Tax=Methylopila musalis TaxID=1134781 RepID=A0ABW3Z862_9HYPH